MRVCRFNDNRLGLVEGDEVRDVTAVLEDLPPIRWPVPHGDHLMHHLAALRPAMEQAAASAPARPVGDVTLRSPVANPGKILAAPVNYQKHLDESRADAGINFGGEVKTIEDYGLFFKAPSSLVGPGDGVVADRPERRTDHEIELAVVIGRTGRSIPESDALAHVAGYTIGLDMTIRGTEDRSYRKSLDTFTVLGPWLVTADELRDAGSLAMELKVNGELRQCANTSQLIWAVPRLIAYASAAYTLYPGDVILTGTPEGVGPVFPGDRIVARIEKIGEMQVAVR